MLINYILFWTWKFILLYQPICFVSFSRWRALFSIHKSLFSDTILHAYSKGYCTISVRTITSHYIPHANYHLSWGEETEANLSSTVFLFFSPQQRRPVNTDPALCPRGTRFLNARLSGHFDKCFTWTIYANFHATTRKEDYYY